MGIQVGDVEPPGFGIGAQPRLQPVALVGRGRSRQQRLDQFPQPLIGGRRRFAALGHARPSADRVRLTQS
jgi:hypothetical protein